MVMAPGLLFSPWSVKLIDVSNSRSNGPRPTDVFSRYSVLKQNFNIHHTNDGGIRTLWLDNW